jgi:hypothetical protein
MVTAAAIPWPLSPWHLEHLWEKTAAPSGAVAAEFCAAASPQDNSIVRQTFHRPGMPLD